MPRNIPATADSSTLPVPRPRGWVNDYGDVPRWWRLIRPRYQRDRRGRFMLGMIAAMAGGLGAFSGPRVR